MSGGPWDVSGDPKPWFEVGSDAWNEWQRQNPVREEPPRTARNTPGTPEWKAHVASLGKPRANLRRSDWCACGYPRESGCQSCGVAFPHAVERPADATAAEWGEAVRKVFTAARGDAYLGSIPSHWLEVMRDRLLEP